MQSSRKSNVIIEGSYTNFWAEEQRNLKNRQAEFSQTEIFHHYLFIKEHDSDLM